MRPAIRPSAPARLSRARSARSMLGTAVLGTALFALPLVAATGCKPESPDAAPEDLLRAPAPEDLLGAPPDLTAPPDLAAPPVDPTLQWNGFWLQRGADFDGWTANGAGARNGQLVLTPRIDPALTCEAAAIDGGAASFDPTSGLCKGTEPTVTGLPAGVTYYGGAPFYFGTVRSPEIHVAQPIDHVIASWNAETPPGTFIQIHVRARVSGGPTDGTWTRWYSLPIWAADFSTIKRHSVDGSSDASGAIDTDTFRLKGGLVASAYQIELTLFSQSTAKTPSVRLVAAVASKDMSKYPTQVPDSSVWGTDLSVPGRSQGLPEYKDQGYGGGGEVWCSPTSTSMVMAYWSTVTGQASLTQTVPAAAAGTYDAVYDGTGNWPFNTAYAATLGLVGWVTRLHNLSQAEAFIKAGVPLIISISFKPGELPGAPISQTGGHLIVLRGFSPTGDPIVNDPAAKTDATTHLTYPRAALENAWTHSHRTAYVMFPAGRAVPAQGGDGRLSLRAMP